MHIIHVDHFTYLTIYDATQYLYGGNEHCVTYRLCVLIINGKSSGVISHILKLYYFELSMLNKLTSYFLTNCYRYENDDNLCGSHLIIYKN